MQYKPNTGYLELTAPWEFRADNGLLLRGRRAAGNGPTLHFLSGNGFCGGVYWPFLRLLMPEFGLFVHDIEGQGGSEAPAKFSGTRKVLRRVQAVLDAQQDLGPLIGIGHSFGAALTLRLAAQNPGLFRAIVLLDPIVFPRSVWFGMRTISLVGRHPMARSALRRRAAWPSPEAALSHLRDRGIYQGWTEESLACFVEHAMEPRDGAHVLSCPPHLEAQIYERPLYPWRDFRRVDCPVLFLHGANSYEFFAWAARLARRTNPRVQVSTAPGEHCFMLQDPASAQAAVREFLHAV